MEESEDLGALSGERLDSRIPLPPTRPPPKEMQTEKEKKQSAFVGTVFFIGSSLLCWIVTEGGLEMENDEFTLLLFNGIRVLFAAMIPYCLYLYITT